MGAIYKHTELSSLIEKFAAQDGVHSTMISSLELIRSSTTTLPVLRVHEPALCIVTQGSKVVMLEQERYSYGPSDYLVVSVDLPISAQITEASPEDPYLCIRLKLESLQIFDILKELSSESIKKRGMRRGIFVSETDEYIIDAVTRLVRLLEKPEDVPIIGPLIIREIYYRVLKGEQGEYLKQIVLDGSNVQRIVRVINQIKNNYAAPLPMEELAHSVHMSPASLFRHFKEVAAMSPLQYQKKIRLLEARRLLLSEAIDASEAGYRVGYESPSQFSREYRRMFGMPPVSDIKQLQNALQK
ncbi:AraC family transcriptional regulator [Paenibacillus cellulosilyticus]|uniref:AraC family transcriptional regulator n=1 Tax=Paenibacillus cellulosilyticus TaxID=375489 RepID=A0A2V2Z5R9_9BACL|nr:AraC family transcriptional regulator [Paenibacillus cellulosilyticus]PWW06190.1 AraC family transcriptional regulator [Paenibacillus cellulosilyticus]QKS43345.1 AraC family transcriptional regulator [Paenibacillus cellulosilyticus]